MTAVGPSKGEATKRDRTEVFVEYTKCAFCTFPDKPTAASELARVLRPGGRLGITDVTADLARLPAELTSLTAWVACVPTPDRSMATSTS